VTRSTHAAWPSCCVLNHLSPVYHGEHGLRSLKATGWRSYYHHQRSGTGHDAGEGHLSQLGHPLHRQAGLCAAPIVPSGSGRSANRECAASGSFTTNNSMRCGRCVRKCERELLAEAQKHHGLETALPILRSVRSGSRTAWHSADPAPFPHQAAAVDLQRIGIETHSSADHRSVDGQLKRVKKQSLHSRTEPQTAITI